MRKPLRFLILTLGKPESTFVWGAYFNRLLSSGSEASVLGSKPIFGVASLILQSIAQSIRGCNHERSFDILVSNGAIIGLSFSILSRILRIRKPHIIIDVGISGLMKFRLASAMLHLMSFQIRRSEGIICYAKSEMMTWTARGFRRVYFVPLSMSQNSVNCNLATSAKLGEYIFSGGKTSRDYVTLCNAVEGLEVPVVIVSGKDPVSGRDSLDTVSKIPRNVEVYRDLSPEEFNSLLSNCSFMVLPLKSTVYPVGQTVLLTAMSFGKAVIATSNPGTVDYIDHNETGMLIPPNDPTALRSAIVKLFRQNDLRNNFGWKARRKVEKSYSEDKIAKMFIEICNSLRRKL